MLKDWPVILVSRVLHLKWPDHSCAFSENNTKGKQCHKQMISKALTERRGSWNQCLQPTLFSCSFNMSYHSVIKSVNGFFYTVTDYNDI
jgi:hypothetical protein